MELVLLDLVAQQAARQRRGVDGHARELGQHVRQAADVVLVGVGDEERLDLVAALLEVGDVGHDEVDAEHLLVGEHQPAVDDDDVVAVLEDVHVLADLADAAERDDAERLAGSGAVASPSAGTQKIAIWSASGAAVGRAATDGSRGALSARRAGPVRRSSVGLGGWRGRGRRRGSACRRRSAPARRRHRLRRPAHRLVATVGAPPSVASVASRRLLRARRGCRRHVVDASSAAASPGGTPPPGGTSRTPSASRAPVVRIDRAGSCRGPGRCARRA